MPTIRVDEEVYEALQRRAKPFIDTPNSVLRRGLGLDPSEEETGGQRRRRAAPGSLLRRFAYDEPILTVLARHGGSAPANTVLDEVGGIVREQLTEVDKQPVKSGMVRWRNRAMWRRYALVGQGLLRDNSPRGLWELTEAGWEKARQLEGGH